MEGSCGPTKPKTSSVDVKIGESSSGAEEITGNVKQVDLPHLVVGKILENLKFKDLLQCSLVSKFWHHEARRLLREKHECALTVDLDKPAIKEIMNLKTMLAGAEWSLPYGSLSIRKKIKYIGEEEYIFWWTQEERELVESAIRNIILRAGPFELVQLDINCGTDISLEACISRKMLEEVQKTVKVLIVKNLDGWDLFENARRLPELKKLDIYVGARIFEPDVMRIQNFVKYSEKLETVGRMSSRWLVLLETVPPARKLAVIKEFTCANMNKYKGRAAEFAKLEPKLEKLYFPREPYDPYAWRQPDETSSIFMSLLLSSRASLIELQVTYDMLKEIRREKPFLLFENLRCLTVDAPNGWYREDLDGDEAIVALCPNLAELNVNPDPTVGYDLAEDY